MSKRNDSNKPGKQSTDNQSDKQSTDKQQSRELQSILATIPPRTQEFLRAYLDPESPTYSNGTQSYKRAYTTTKDNVAAASAHNLLRSRKNQQAMEAILEELGIDRTATMRHIANIINGSKKYKSSTTIKDKDGDVKQIQETVSDPRASDVIRAIDMRAKLTGWYDDIQLESKVKEAEVTKLYRELSGELRDITPETDEDSPQSD